VSKNLTLHCLFYVTMNMYFYFYFYIARDIVTVLLVFVDIYHFIIHFHMRIYMHTLKHSAHEEWRETGTGTWLGGAEVGFC